MTAPRHDSDVSLNNPAAKRRFGLLVRVILFAMVVIACGFYSRIFQGIWTTVFPLTCANGSTALFFVDFDAFPARMGDQDNLCQDVGDGECKRTAADDIVHGECRSGRMHGKWSVANGKTGLADWSGTYCDGLPCGDFRVRIDAEHENVFRVENLHIHGPATIWEHQENRLVEFSGRFDRGKRVGRWVRRALPSKTVRSTIVYDDHGIMKTASYYCTNGNLKEYRGTRMFIFDAQGKIIAEQQPLGTLEPTPDAGVDDQSLCPLP